MLNIIILEDQTEQAERLSQMLKKYAEAHEGFSYQLKLYDRSIPFLTEYKCDADILFMDIQVPDMLGIDAAKRVRQMDNRVMIIFITMLTQRQIVKDFLIKFTKNLQKGARSTVWLLTPRLIDYIFPFSRSLQRYA